MPSGSAPRMTLRVYRLRPDGSRVAIGPRVQVTGEDSGQLAASQVFPPCACRQCRAGKARVTRR